MRRFLPMVLWGLLLAGNLPAMPPDKDKPQPTGKSATQTTKPAAEHSSSRRSTKPAAYTPTEKIGADSAVSFPVDI